MNRPLARAVGVFVTAILTVLTTAAFCQDVESNPALDDAFRGAQVIDLATSRRNGKARAKAALETAFGLLATDAPSPLQGIP